MTKEGIQALTELLNSRSQWVRDRAIRVNNSLKVKPMMEDNSKVVPLMEEKPSYYERLDYLSDSGYENTEPYGSALMQMQIDNGF